MAVLKDAIKALDPAPNTKTELTLALELISSLAKSKTASFEEAVATSYRTAGTGENRTAPITLVVASHAEYRAYVKDDAGKLAEEVTSAIKDFIGGGSTNIVTGISKLVTAGLAAILGTGEASEQEMRSYYITAQSRALVRYDVLAWRRKIEATGITSKIESCLAIYASKASIDVKKLDLNTFLLAYEDQLYKMGFSDQETVEYIAYAEKVYRWLTGEGPRPDEDERAMVAGSSLAPDAVPQIHRLLEFDPPLPG